MWYQTASREFGLQQTADITNSKSVLQGLAPNDLILGPTISLNGTASWVSDIQTHGPLRKNSHGNLNIATPEARRGVGSLLDLPLKLVERGAGIQALSHLTLKDMSAFFQSTKMLIRNSF